MPEWRDEGRGVAFNPPPGFPGQQQHEGAITRLPQRGAFAISETIPLILEASERMATARAAWVSAREDRDAKKAEAKRLRANYIVKLRVIGAEATGSIPIKTSAERQEWADANPEIQQAELDADLAQTVQMAAYEAYQDAQSAFEVLRSVLGIERDDMKREHNGPPS